MPINLQGSGNISEGWGAPPQLSAPSIGSLVSAILEDRRAREKQLRDAITGTIGNVREERQSGEYLDAMKAAGLIPQDYDAGGLGGAKMGTGLATMLWKQKEFDALEKHRRAMEARAGGRGRGGGGGGGGGGSVEPQTVWKDGIEWRPGPGGRWIPMKPAAGTKADVPKLSPTEKGWAAPEIPGLSVNINAPDEDTQSLAPAIPPMPEPQRTPPPADSAAGHASDYGVKASDDTSGVRVKVVSPDGKVGTLPASQLQDALAMGFKQVP